MLNLTNVNDPAEALMNATVTGNLSSFDQLLNNGADPCKVKTLIGNNILMIACVNNQMGIIERICQSPSLLQTIGGINFRNNEGMTALAHATEEDNLNIFKYLLEHGADPTIRTANDENILMIAARGSVNIVVYLLSHPQLLARIGGINDEDNHGMSALCFAAQAPRENLSIFKILMQRGAQLVTKGGRNALQIAVDTESYSITNWVMSITNDEEKAAAGVTKHPSLPHHYCIKGPGSAYYTSSCSDLAREISAASPATQPPPAQPPLIPSATNSTSSVSSLSTDADDLSTKVNTHYNPR